MNNPFIKEIMLINRVMLTAVLLIVLALTWYYGDGAAAWTKSLVIVAVIVIALLTKKWRVGRQAKELDERLQIVTYYALAVGFYAMLAIVFLFSIKEFIQFGYLSIRSQAELFAGMLGNLGAFYYFKRKM
jgi:hypothetical protein